MKKLTRDHYKQVVQHVKVFILMNIDARLTLPGIAREVNLSAFHLARIFKNETGVSIKHFILLRRMEACLRDIVHTDRQLKDIALSMGFNDYSSFCRGFKKRYRVAPDDLRKLIGVIRTQGRCPSDAEIRVSASMEEAKAYIESHPDKADRVLMGAIHCLQGAKTYDVFPFSVS